MTSRFTTLLKHGIDLILPPRCPINGEVVDKVGAISPEAWKGLTFISDPKCACCGIPFEIDGIFDTAHPEEFLCADCIATPHIFDKARSVFVYDDGSRKMILAFKHSDALHLHTTLAPLMVTLGQDFLTPDSILVPVPLHWLRLLKRRYNQSAILAQEIGKITALPCWVDALIRTRHTPPQGHKSAKDRHQNVAKAFDIHPDYITKIQSKNIVLVDDVFTTGATLDECAKVLKASGAKSVNVLTVARVKKS